MILKQKKKTPIIASAKAKPIEKPLQNLFFPVDDCANKGHGEN